MNESAFVDLKVSEAAAEDVGRGIVRLDPQAMAALGLEAGDVVQIRQNLDQARAALAKALPTRPEDRDQGLVQMDGVLRANARVKLGGTVRVATAVAEPAVQVVLRPLTVVSRHEPLTPYLKKALLDLPVQAGDQVRVNLFGSGFQNFEVTHTQPRGGVLITGKTAISVERPSGEAAAAPRRGMSYEDVGGLRAQLDRIREMIELPLKSPQLFEQLGIDPPKGVLLYGPPGTGKTLIARALADETDAYFVSIAGPEVLSMFYGQSEANLRKVFSDAQRNQPAILFIDEIDALTPKRAEVTGEVEKRVVSQLLALMDGLERRQQVVVIGATNIPDALDPALRRPGRFDRELHIPIPDTQGRLEILKIHTRGMPLADNVDLARLAQTTHGFVGADLESLCREAAMKALRRILPSLEQEGDGPSYEALFNLRVAWSDFEAALTEVEPSAMREVFVEVPSVRWTDVGGLDGVMARLREAVEWPLQHREAFDHFGLRPSTGVLLHGPSGTGKTLLAQAVANECGLNFITVKGPELLSRFVGDSEKRVRDVFRHARHAAPCILFIDELDALAGERGHSLNDSADRVTSQLLTEMDGIEGLRGVVVIGATNRLEAIDPALLRPGRLEQHLALELPDAAGREAIFAVHARRLPLADELDLASLALLSEGFSGAQIAFACREAALEGVRRYVAAGAGALLADFALSADDLLRAIDRLRGRTLRPRSTEGS